MLPIILIVWIHYSRTARRTPVKAVHIYKNGSGDYLPCIEDTNTQKIQVVLKKAFRRSKWIIAEFAIGHAPLEIRRSASMRERWYKTQEGEASTKAWTDKERLEISASSMVTHDALGKVKTMGQNFVDSLPTPFKAQILPIFTGFFGGITVGLLLAMLGFI